jgi:3-oxoacyl-[acyl-carrier-protein] synthase-1
VNGEEIPVVATSDPFLTALYRRLGIDYPRFFKMDGLSKLGFLASELLFWGDASRFLPREDCAVICFSRTSSLDTDRRYQASMRDYPSPSLFVYTLPNIVTAEIAIRNKLYGETSVYICETYNPHQIFRTIRNTFAHQPLRSALAGWTEYDGDTGEAFLMQIETQAASASEPLLSAGFLTTAKHNL